MTTTSASGPDTDESRQPDAADQVIALQVPFTPSSLTAMFGEKLEGLRQTLGENQTCRLHVFDVATRSATEIAELRLVTF